MKKSNTKKMKMRAWKAFSLYIRNKGAKNGTNQCYTCGHTFEIKKLNAGHGIAGRNNAVLFMEEVVRPQCIGCNMFLRGNYKLFTYKLIKELGMKKYEKLIEESNQTVKYKEADYQAILEKYEDMLSKL